MTLSVLHPPAGATSSFVAFRVEGQIDFTSTSTQTLLMPSGATVDPAGHLLVVDRNHNRVLGWNSVPTANGVPPDFVLGQNGLVGTSPNRGATPAADTLRCPIGLWSDGSRLVVGDYGNGRVLIWNNLWSAGTPSNGRAADLVLGRPNMTSGPAAGGDPCFPADSRATSADMTRNPVGVASDGTKLFVVDSTNHRVLVWLAFPVVNGQSADLVLGQSTFTSGTANSGGIPSASTFNTPTGVATDGSRLVVTDAFNHRVLIWSDLPQISDPNALPADLVLGQASMSGGGVNASPPGAPNATDGGNGKPSARSLNMPVEAAVSGGMLLIADHKNNRVLVYRNVPTSNFARADDEIGHGRFTSNDYGVSNTLLRDPWGVSLYSQGIVVADASNNRVLMFPRPVSASSRLVSAVPEGSLAIRVGWEAHPGVSGYRIYRDGFWHSDTSSTVTSFLDSELSPDIYSYTIAPLSDSNRVETSAMGSASATAAGTLPPLKVIRHNSYARYLAEGDSVTAQDGQYAAPEDMYFNQMWTYFLPTQRMNAARSGSACLLGNFRTRLVDELASFNPDLVTLGIGLNDSTQGYQGTHGVYAMAAFSACLKAAINDIAPSPSRTLILLNFHHMTNWKMTDPVVGGGPDVGFSNGSEAKKRAWNKVVRDVAAHGGVPVVDVTSAMDTAIQRAATEGSSETFLIADNVHPNQAGQDVIADGLLDVLLDYLPDFGGPAHPGRPRTPMESIDTQEPSVDVTWSWDASSDPLASNGAYEVAWSRDPTFRTDFQSALTNDTSMTLTLTQAKWHVKVRGIGTDGTPGHWSNWTRVHVGADQPPPPPPVPPSKPGKPEVTLHEMWVANHTVRVQWAPSVDDGDILDYELCWTKVVGPHPYPGECVRTATDVTSYWIQFPLPPGVWEFRVRAYDTQGYKSAWSDLTYWASPFV